MLHTFTLHFICSYALSPMHLFILLVRSFICSFARSLFVQSSVCFLFVYSLVCLLFLLSHSFPFSFFFLTRFFSLSLTHSSFFFIIINFISSHPRVVPFSLGLLTCLFVRHSVAFWFPVPLPLPYPLPLKFFLSFCPLLSSYLLFFSY